MKKFQKYYNKEYDAISFYAIKTVLAIFILGLVIYYLAGKMGYVLSFASAVLKPLVLGMVLTYLLSPVVEKLQNRFFSSFRSRTAGRGAAVILTFAIIIAVLIFLIGIIVTTLTQSLSAFSLADLKDYLTILSEQFSRFWTTIEKQLASMNINLGSVGDMLGAIFNGVKSGASTLLFACIFAVYFLIDDRIGAYWIGILDVFTTEKTRKGLRMFAENADRVFSGYIRGQSLDALIIGVLVTIALLIAGVPYAVVIGILTGFGNLVPYVGPVVGFGSLIIVCLAEASVTDLIVGAVILAAVMFIDGNVINPRMLSSNVEVHPVLVIVALLAGGKVGGVVGMLVAVPVAALIKLQFEKYVDKRRAKRAAEESETEPEQEPENLT